MKVGTDGVLLGAWGCVEGKRILDVGTGTGLIALMAAQRNPEANVLGIDIDEAAILQARENIAESPFSDRVSCVLCDLMAFQIVNGESSNCKCFDAILCNPPFFTEDTLPDDKGRALARNNKSLPFEQLIPKVASLLANDGTFSLIIPSQLATELIGLCLNEGLHLVRRCLIRTTAHKPPRRTLMTLAHKPPRRTLMTFSFDCRPQNADCRQEELVLMTDDGNRSQAYQELTKDFYL